MKSKKEKIGLGLLLLLGIVAFSTFCLIGPIYQDESYHQFCDTHTCFSLSNCWNVLSNLAFAVVGVFGLVKIKFIFKNKIPYLIVFVGAILVSLGSGYYHLNPTNATLIWDRLPMTIVFMSLLSTVISEFVNYKKGRLLLFPLLLLGVMSVWYWSLYGDLRPYIFIQFYPMVAIPAILIFFKSNYNKTFGYWLLFLSYGIAKILEHFDCELFNLLHIVSGHTLKHIISALGLLVWVYTSTQRKNIKS